MSNMGSNYSGSTPLLASGKRGHTTGMQTDYSIYGGPHYDHMYGPHYGPPYAPPPPPPQPQVYVLPIPGESPLVLCLYMQGTSPDNYDLLRHMHTITSYTWYATHKSMTS